MKQKVIAGIILTTAVVAAPIFLASITHKNQGQATTTASTLQELGLQGSEICQPNYARSHRMSYSTSWAIKRRFMALVGASDPRLYELDHILPLELGGGNEISNLALEPIQQAKVKDWYENYYHNEFCLGRMSLEQAKREVVKYE